MSTHETLSAASNDRKARLAQLKSLKRKQAPTEDDASGPPSEDATTSLAPPTSTDIARKSPDISATILSGRNYDPETRNAKLGFASPPPGVEGNNTLEARAAELALSSKTQQAAEKAETTGLDFTKLQPKKPNWDLKRDWKEKVRETGLDVATENAIARLVRERVEEKRRAKGEEVGMEGSELVEAMHLKEKEEEEERRREVEDGET